LNPWHAYNPEYVQYASMSRYPPIQPKWPAPAVKEFFFKQQHHPLYSYRNRWLQWLEMRGGSLGNVHRFLFPVPQLYVTVSPFLFYCPQQFIGQGIIFMRHLCKTLHFPDGVNCCTSRIKGTWHAYLHKRIEQRYIIILSPTYIL